MTAEHETECGYEQQAQADAEWEALAARVQENHERLTALAAPKAPPYRVELVRRTELTGRYRITKADGTTYYTTYGTAGMSCTCPDARLRPGRQGRCKHCVWIARFVGRPELVKS